MEHLVDNKILCEYQSGLQKTFERPLINCVISQQLTWSEHCVITYSTGAGTFSITDTKLYVPVVTLSFPNDANLLEQLKSGFKGTINWNKYDLELKTYGK